MGSCYVKVYIIHIELGMKEEIQKMAHQTVIRALPDVGFGKGNVILYACATPPLLPPSP